MIKDTDIFEGRRKKRHDRWKKFKENNILMDYTVMLVPHSEKKPRQLKMPAGIILLFLITVVTLLGLTTYWAYSAYCLKLVEAENAGLKKISSSQERQISELDRIADDMLKRLDAVSEAEDAVREKVGLSPSMEGVGGIAANSFTEPAQPSPDARLAGDRLLQVKLDFLESKFDAVNALLCDAEGNAVVLAEQVNEQLKRINSIPDRWPISGARYTSSFGGRSNPFEDGTYEQHSGIDLACEYGTPIYAAGRGTVFTAIYMEGWGNVVMIDHGYGYRTVYAHLSEIGVSVGQEVAKGEQVGCAGSTGKSTGTHLHFSVEYNGEFIDPLEVLAPTDDILDLEY